MVGPAEGGSKLFLGDIQAVIPEHPLPGKEMGAIAVYEHTIHIKDDAPSLPLIL